MIGRNQPWTSKVETSCLLSINWGSNSIQSESCVNPTWIGFPNQQATSASNSSCFNIKNYSYLEFPFLCWYVNKVVGSENFPLDCGLLQHKSFEHWLCTINRTCIFTACLIRWHIYLNVILKSEPDFSVCLNSQHGYSLTFCLMKVSRIANKQTEYKAWNASSEWLWLHCSCYSKANQLNGW